MLMSKLIRKAMSAMVILCAISVVSIAGCANPFIAFTGKWETRIVNEKEVRACVEGGTECAVAGTPQTSIEVDIPDFVAAML